MLLRVLHMCVQVDICPEEFHTTLPTSVALHGDLAAVVTQVLYSVLHYGIHTFCLRYMYNHVCKVTTGIRNLCNDI